MKWIENIYITTEYQTYLDRLHKKKQTLHDFRPLPAIAMQRIKEALTIEWTYHSNSIEGNTLSLRKTQRGAKERKKNPLLL